jgi:hypothetical protein
MDTENSEDVRDDLRTAMYLRLDEKELRVFVNTEMKF